VALDIRNKCVFIIPLLTNGTTIVSLAPFITQTEPNRYAYLNCCCFTTLGQLPVSAHNRYVKYHWIIHSNPLSGIKEVFMANKVTNNPHVAPEELSKLLLSIATANIKKITRNLILWQLHTMTRPAEADLAKWDEVYYENKLWIVPAVRMKTGIEHKIPLTKKCYPY